MSRLSALPGLALQPWQPHALHGEEAAWAEKNCYADLWIGLLHALRLEPRALMGFTLAVDFEGDQWTFFKPAPGDLWELYGVDVQELTIWRPLLDHAVEQLSAGRLVSPEVDAWWLPDTAATDYRSKHTKTTILMAELDVQAQRLGYFHNSGYYELEGEDFRAIFGLDEFADASATRLPLFAELVKIDRRVARPPQELARIALAALRRHLARRPATNPFHRYAARLEKDAGLMGEQGLAHYHAWAFAAVRQCGAAFELAADHLRWLESVSPARFGGASDSFDAIALANKTLILKGARAASAGRALDASALVAGMAAQWEDAMAAVARGLESAAW